MPLRKADITSTRRFEDGADWIVLRTQLSKGESDVVRDLTASYSVDQADGGNPIVEVKNRTSQANSVLFEILCDSWSLGEVSRQAYSELDIESGQWVDDCIEQVLRERRERAEKNVRSSKKPSRRASSSATAERSA